MLDRLTTRDAAESFLWTDGTFESVRFIPERDELTIDFTDQRAARHRFVFHEVADAIIADPVYCIRSSHEQEAGQRKLVLMDDDGIVLSFRYGRVERHAPLDT